MLQPYKSGVAHGAIFALRTGRLKDKIILLGPPGGSPHLSIFVMTLFRLIDFWVIFDVNGVRGVAVGLNFRATQAGSYFSPIRILCL